MITDNIISAKLIKQNNQQFLLGSFSIRQILSFTRYTHRLIVGYDDDNFPIYNNEIQRKTEPSRVEKIADFLINDPDALFPTNIVLAVPESVILNIDNETDTDVKLTLDDVVFREVARPNGDIHLTIIDGQHRIRGIERAIERLESDIKSIQQILSSGGANLDLKSKSDYFGMRLQKLRDIELMVSFFIAPTLEFQAMIFSTINRTQKSVPQSLVFELFGLTAGDSPQKTSLQTVLSLNSYERSPFFNRIKLHGGRYERNQSPPLTQAGMVKSIIDLISANARSAENDRFKQRKELLKGITSELYFRRYYAINQDDRISDIMFAYFTAVKTVFIDQRQTSFWEFEETNKANNVLQTTVGYHALLLLLRDILLELEEEEKDKISSYERYLTKARSLNFADARRYPFTGRTKRVLYFDISLKIWPAINQDDERTVKLAELLNEN